MTRAVSLEFYKARRRGMWLVVAAFAGMLLLWLLFSVRNPSEDERASGWVFLVYTAPLLQSIMAPVLAAVLASRLADLEWKGNTLKLLETVQRPSQLYAAKALCGTLYLGVYTALCCAVMLAAGLCAGFYGAPSLTQYALSALFVFAAAESLFLFQLAFSMLVRGQMAPLTAGLLGAFLGLLLLYMPPSPLTALLPWGEFSALMLVGMNWDPVTRFIEYYAVPPNWAAFICCLLWCAALFGFGCARFCRKEV